MERQVSKQSVFCISLKHIHKVSVMFFFLNMTFLLPLLNFLVTELQFQL